MPIKVNVSLTAGGQLKPVSSRTLDEAHITIGRDKECSLTLEDAQKHVSRVHAKLDAEAGIYLMTVVSKVNPVMVNGKRHMYEERVALTDGDILTIGLYKLEILIPPVPAKTAPPPPPRPAAPPPAAFAEDMTYIPPAQAEDPTPAASAIPDDFSEDMTYMPPARSRAPAPATPPAPQARGLPIGVGADADSTYIPPAPGEPPADDEITFVRPAASEMTNPLGRASKPAAPPPEDEEDFSEDATYVRRPAPLAPPAPVPVAPPPPAAEEAEEDFSEDATYVRRPAPVAPPAPAPVAQPPAAKEQEEDFSEDATYVRRPSAPVPAPAPTPQAAAAPAEELDIELDFDLPEGTDLSEEMTMYRPGQALDADLSEDLTQYRPAVPPAAPAQALDADLSEELTQYRPAAQASAPAPARSFAPPAAGETGRSERALQAFLEGARLGHLDIADPEAFLRESGETMRAAIQGITMLMLASTAVKKSLGAGTGDDVNGSDNPLKSISDPAKAVAYLFDATKRPAFGPTPVEALDDVCSDLRVHQIALMAAMQAVVLSALQSVDPRLVEREQGGNLGGLSMTRKSKLWDLVVAHHEKVTLDIGESFNRAFGPDVQAAYLAEVRRIRGER